MTYRHGNGAGPGGYRTVMAQYAGVRFGRIIEDAIRNATGGDVGGDALEWDFAPFVMPMPAGAPPRIGYLLIVSCRSLLLTAPRVAMCDVIEDSSPAEARIQTTVASVVQQLYEARAALARAPGAQGLN
jgi:hypothetical protein